MSSGIVLTVVDRAVRGRAARWLGRAGARLPTFAELADPSSIAETRKTAVRSAAADRGALADRHGARLLFSDDRRAQGAGGLWLSNPSSRHRPVRSDASQG